MRVDTEIDPKIAQELLEGTDYMEMMYKYLGIFPCELVKYRERGYKFKSIDGRLKLVVLMDISDDGIRYEEEVFGFDNMIQVPREIDPGEY